MDTRYRRLSVILVLGSPCLAAAVTVTVLAFADALGVPSSIRRVATVSVFVVNLSLAAVGAAVGGFLRDRQVDTAIPISAVAVAVYVVCTASLATIANLAFDLGVFVEARR